MGLSLLSWGALGILHEGGLQQVSIARSCISTLHTSAAILFFMRSPELMGSNWKDYLCVLPSFVLYGLVFRNALPLSNWPIYAETIFVIGTLITIFSLLYLGRSFAIFPAKRKLIAKGPYRFVRHPMYCGEILMLLACGCVANSLQQYCLCLLTLGAMFFRILREERIFGSTYEDYERQVTWRLLPGIW